MIFLTIRYTNVLLFLLLLALVLPAGVASTSSAIARSSRNKRSTGFEIISNELNPDLFKRQGTPATTAAAPPASTPDTPPPATTAAPPPASTPDTPPPATTAVAPPASTPDQPASSSAATSTAAGSVSNNTNVVPAPTQSGVAPSQSGSVGNGTDVPAPSQSLQTTSSSTSYSLSYEFATVTGPGGSESISIGTVSISEAVVPVTTDPAIAAAPLVIQQAAPDAPPTPICQLQYLPDDVWETTGSTSDNTTTTSANGPSPHPAVVSQCNNGTRVTNKVGAQIHLTFTGTEVSLLMVPGVMGGAYDVKMDNEDSETLNNYKADTTSCEVSTTWSRTNLTNEPHDITITVKGSPAGSVGGSQVEFNGLVFKGPQTTTTSSGPNWVIIGASIGAGVIVIALIIILILCIRRRRAQRAAPTPVVPRPPSTVSSFRPQTVISGHARTDSNFSGTPQVGHYRGDSNFSNAPSGHYRGDSSFSGAPYSPGSPSQVLQQNPFGHSRQPSDVPLMMQQAHQAPWQIPTGGMANVPSGSPYHSNVSSPQSRPLTFVGYSGGHERPPGAGYGNAQERQSFVQSHDRTTSYGSDGRNPFE